jgi:hypothetical protein
VETAALTVERLELGADGSPDLLTISFSEVDYVGHRYTPESWEAQDNLLWLDRDLGTLFTRLDALGIAWAAVLTADHGVLPTPAALLSGWDVAEHIDGALAAAGIAGSATWLNPGIWLAGVPDSRRSDALSIALATARDIDGVGIAVPGAGPIDPSTPFREQIAACRAPGRTAEVLLWPRWGVAWLDEAHVPRGARPTAPPEPMATDHGTPYAYDREVPILAFGAGVTATATTADRTETFYDMRRVAPTVACLVGVVPAGGLDALPVAKTLRCPR